MLLSSVPPGIQRNAVPGRSRATVASATVCATWHALVIDVPDVSSLCHTAAFLVPNHRLGGGHDAHGVSMLLGASSGGGSVDRPEV